MTLTTQNPFIQAFRSLPGCQTCMFKRGMSFHTLRSATTSIVSLGPVARKRFFNKGVGADNIKY